MLVWSGRALDELRAGCPVQEALIMRMKSLMTVAEAAGYAMASYEIDPVEDADEASAVPMVPDAAPVRRDALVPSRTFSQKSLTESLLRGCMSFSGLLTRRAAA